MHPTPTCSNVADIGTKLLSVSRTEYLLGLLNFRDASSGYDRVGEAQLDVDRNVHAIRNVCNDLSKIAKADATANTARILSVILVAMQATGALGEPDESHDSDEQSYLDGILEWFLECFVQVNALYAAYPATCVALLQCIFLLACFCCAMYCCRKPYGGHQSSVQVHVGDGVTIDVRTSDRFSVPLRDPASAGPKAPGTPAFPLHFSSDDDEFKGDVHRTCSRIVPARMPLQPSMVRSPRLCLALQAVMQDMHQRRVGLMVHRQVERLASLRCLYHQRQRHPESEGRLAQNPCGSRQPAVRGFTRQAVESFTLQRP